VTVSFIENRYKKGEVEKLRIVDRIFIRDSKVFRVNQWNGTVD
jgi:glycerol-3-phosphate responsive antiterminator